MAIVVKRDATRLILFLIPAMLGACSVQNARAPYVPAPPGDRSLQRPMQNQFKQRCDGFISNFYELVACRRTNGTLDAFGEPQIAWRVRYFVRYERMPCGEAPTVQEAYVFHMVMDDLNSDGGLNDAQRSAIRTAMFDGPVHC